ncbi:hypothetical protein [Streptomyces sp. NPDC002516]
MHVNTLLLQDMLREEEGQERLTDADRRALSPLIWTHGNPRPVRAGHEPHLALAAAAATLPGLRGNRTAGGGSAP